MQILYKHNPPIDGVYLVCSKHQEPPTPYLVKGGKCFDQDGEVLNIDCYWQYVGAVEYWGQYAQSNI